MLNKKFNLEESYAEIILTKIISKKDLLGLINQEGISFDSDFDVGKASQFDMGVILMNDIPTKDLLEKIEKLRTAKYPRTRTLAEASSFISNLEKYEESELVRIYLQAPFDSKIAHLLEGTLKNKTNQLTKNDLLYFFLEGYC